MRRALSFLILICLLATVTGCNRGTEPSVPANNAETSTTAQTEGSQPTITHKQLSMAALSVPAVTESKHADDGQVIFNYTYQNMSLILQEPEIADKVIIDFLNRIDSTTETANSILTAAQTAYTPSDTWIPYLCNITYSPMRIDHGVLSLFGSLVTYSGASHPERSCLSASYDLVTGDVLTLASIMSMEATNEDFCKLTIEALSEIADAKYLYDGYEQTVTERFSGDSSQDESWFFNQRGLCFYFAPYEIAPYSSGIITVEIPYEKLAGLLHDGYFPAERATASGDVDVISFADADMTQFTQIAEAVIQRDAEKVVLYTQGTVQDVRLIVSVNDSGTDVYTAFASATLTPGDALIIEATNEQLAKMKLSYLSDGQTVTIPIQEE